MDRWPELCKLVEEDDGLPTRDAGSWTEQKLFFWNRYIDITTKAMAGHRAWSGITYVDLFAGCGVCAIRESGRRFPGSALLAAHASKPFSKIILCEEDPEFADACEKRLARTQAADRCHVLVGDCNERIGEIVCLIPHRSLTLAFVDPTGLHAHFSTLEALTADRRVDLLILFTDRMDIVRNVELYFNQPTSNLDRVLGADSDWRRQFSAMGSRDAVSLCTLFSDIYVAQLEKHLGYKYFGYESIGSRAKGSLYRIIYASRSELGREFWEKITTKDRHGQRKLF
jgi:three-Cys-motif partner protein